MLDNANFGEKAFFKDFRSLLRTPNVDESLNDNKSIHSGPMNSKSYFSSYVDDGKHTPRHRKFASHYRSDGQGISHTESKFSDSRDQVQSQGEERRVNGEKHRKVYKRSKNGKITVQQSGEGEHVTSKWPQYEKRLPPRDPNTTAILCGNRVKALASARDVRHKQLSERLYTPSRAQSTCALTKKASSAQMNNPSDARFPCNSRTHRSNVQTARQIPMTARSNSSMNSSRSSLSTTRTSLPSTQRTPIPDWFG